MQRGFTYDVKDVMPRKVQASLCTGDFSLQSTQSAKIPFLLSTCRPKFTEYGVKKTLVLHHVNFGLLFQRIHQVSTLA